MIAPADQKFSAFTSLSSTSAGAWIDGSELGYGLSVRQYVVPEGSQPHIPSEHWKFGPKDHSHTYQTSKKYYPMSRADGREGVLWEDAQDGKVYMTWFSEDLSSAESKLVYTPKTDEVLYAAASNGDDGIVLITAESEEKPADKKKEGTVRAVRISSQSGERVKTQTLEGLNFHKKFASAGSAAWDPEANEVAFMFARLMTQGSDGLNHQGCIAVVIDGDTL